MSDSWGMNRERVIVIGNGGGGKTTLAREVAKATGLPCHEVDQIQFLPGWERADTSRVAERIDAIVATERWIIDGFGLMFYYTDADNYYKLDVEVSGA